MVLCHTVEAISWRHLQILVPKVNVNAFIDQSKNSCGDTYSGPLFYYDQALFK